MRAGLDSELRGASASPPLLSSPLLLPLRSIEALPSHLMNRTSAACNFSFYLSLSFSQVEGLLERGKKKQSSATRFQVILIVSMVPGGRVT
jgi:hypothetical protein